VHGGDITVCGGREWSVVTSDFYQTLLHRPENQEDSCDFQQAMNDAWRVGDAGLNFSDSDQRRRLSSSYVMNTKANDDSWRFLISTNELRYVLAMIN